MDKDFALAGWMREQGWTPWQFQRDSWQAYRSGRSGLVHVATGAGKTYAVFGGPLEELIKVPKNAPKVLRLVYVTPLKALARDIEAALVAPLRDLAPHIRLETRTGDTVAKVRARQAKTLPEVLVTTPESLALLAARADARTALSHVRGVIIDEWHDLLTSKRGMLLQLTLTRLRALSPKLKTWGVSATLEDSSAAAKALVPVGSDAVVIRGQMPRKVNVQTLLPGSVSYFPWAGHLGLSMLKPLISQLDYNVTNIIFTNTRSQAERWYQAIVESVPEWRTITALHHGSLGREGRYAVEEGLKDGTLKIVVATASLDLGVDFPAVEHVYQVGSPKALGRFVQRAGRSAHRPLADCQITCIPTNSFEIIEYAAARRALASGAMETRKSQPGSLDVLCQHLCSCALGGGFTKDEIAHEVKQSFAFGSLSESDLDWCLLFLTTGGTILEAYPNYRKIVKVRDIYCIADRRIASIHRMNIGTIESDATVAIKTMRGRVIGHVDESYVTRLKAGDAFTIAGKPYEFVKMYELGAYVKPSKKKSVPVPAWQGTLLPLSHCLANEVRQLVSEIGTGETASERVMPEIARIQPMLDRQATVSKVPASTEVLFETWAHRDGYHLFCYPFAGHTTNESMAGLLALRLSRRVKTTFAIAANDYGFVLVSTVPVDYEGTLKRSDFSLQDLNEDLDLTIDAAQLAKRNFREIARIAGLVPKNFPGRQKSGTAVHVSASLLYETLNRFDPCHPLVWQAKEAARGYLHSDGCLEARLESLMFEDWQWQKLTRPSPFAFPLVVERVRARLGSESLAERVERMTAAWVREESVGRRTPPAKSSGLVTVQHALDRNGNHLS